MFGLKFALFFWNPLIHFSVGVEGVTDSLAIQAVFIGCYSKTFAKIGVPNIFQLQEYIFNVRTIYNTNRQHILQNITYALQYTGSSAFRYLIACMMFT